MATVDQIVRHDDADPDDDVWVGAPPPVRPIDVVDADPSWPAHYDQLAHRIRRALGDCVLALEHIGSTSVPGLAAKPIIDVDLTVIDSSDESAYVVPLEAAGFVLMIREPGWHQHRMMVATSPLANLHVWSPDSPEAIRHVMFRDWLRDHPNDCRRYANANRRRPKPPTKSVRQSWITTCASNPSCGTSWITSSKSTGCCESQWQCRRIDIGFAGSPT